MAWTPPPPRSGHPYYMHDAIYAQPGALRLAFRANGAAVQSAAERLRGMERVLLAGIGTSWHAALVGELLLARAGKLGYRVRALHSYEFANYWPAPEPRTGVIVVSHRGTKRFSLEALEKARAAGGVGIVVTGKGSGDGLEIGDVLLRTVDQEQSAAHTVSYTTAMALLASVAATLGGDGEIPGALQAIPDQLALLLGQESWEELATRFGDRRRYYFVGGGPNRATAYEAALKMNEANFTTAIGLECEQFLHGPWAAMGPEDVVFVIAPPGASYERGVSIARLAREVGTPVVALVADGDTEIAPLAAETITLPDVPELLSPILAVVPLQLFTYHLALVRGTNPDTMRTDQPAHGRALKAVSL